MRRDAVFLEQNLTTGKIAKPLISFSLPMILGTDKKLEYMAKTVIDKIRADITDYYNFNN